jgi:hypothetical protein
MEQNEFTLNMLLGCHNQLGIDAIHRNLHSQLSKFHERYKVHPIIVKIEVMNMWSTMRNIEIHPSIHPPTHLWLYSPFLDLGHFQFLNLYTVSRTPWTGDQPVARPLPTHRHPFLEWDSNPQSCVWAGEDSACLRLQSHCDRCNVDIRGINIKRGAFQGDVISPLWCCLCFLSISTDAKCTVQRITSPHNMDDLKIVAESNIKLEFLLNVDIIVLPSTGPTGLWGNSEQNHYVFLSIFLHWSWN